MQLLEVSGAVRLIYRSLGVKGLMVLIALFYRKWQNIYRQENALFSPW